MRLVGLLFCVAFLGPQAFGCSVCASKPLKFAFQDSKLFFVGEVKQQQQWNVTFHVLEQFAGDNVSEVTLDTSNSCSMSNFSVGVTYLVEATETQHGLHAYLCSHTQAVEKDTRELRVVRRRAAWWRCPLSRVSLYRLRRLLGRRFGG
jgi:Uri superfamily endonuclease